MQYCDLARNCQESQKGMTKRSQRLVLVSVVIALAMIACVKLAGPVQRSTMRYALADSELVFSSLVNTTTSESAESAEPYDASPEPGQPGHGDEVGGWKKSWSVAEWGEWIIPGPILTTLAVIFIAYLYGPIWAVGTGAILVGIDVFAFYFNV
jgi:hypothetical protein